MNPITDPSGVEAATEAVSSFMIFGALFGLAIFILWIWSMLAIIDSSSNIKRLLELYEEKENRNNPVMNSTTEDNIKDGESKTDKSKQDPEGKSRRVYILAGILIVSLILLGVVVVVYL